MLEIHLIQLISKTLTIMKKANAKKLSMAMMSLQDFITIKKLSGLKDWKANGKMETRCRIGIIHMIRLEILPI